MFTTICDIPPAGADPRKPTKRKIARSRGFRKTCAIFVTLCMGASCYQVAMASGANGWPKVATKKSIVAKVGIDQWNKAERVALCETGKKVRWYITADGTPTGRFIGALGMYVQTFAYGARATGYRGRNFPEQVAIAIASHPITGMWQGWGCRNA